MPDRVQLKAQKRELLGKKVGRLRRAGILPATVYGHRVEPQSIQLNALEFRNLIRKNGTTQLLDLVIEGQAPRPVLIRQTSIDAKRNALLHVEFFQANLREKISSSVPLHFVGDSQAVRDGGIFLPVLDHIEIESLPQDVPAHGIEVDISPITEINGAIHVGDLAFPAGVTTSLPADEVVAKVNPPEPEAVVEDAIADTEPLPRELGGDELPADAVPES